VRRPSARAVWMLAPTEGVKHVATDNTLPGEPQPIRATSEEVTIDPGQSSGASAVPLGTLQEPSAMPVTAPAPEAGGAAPTIANGSVSLVDLAQKLDSLRVVFEKRLAYDQGKEAAIRRLGEELSAYRDDWFERQKRQFLLDLVLFLDTFDDAVRSLGAQAHLTGADVREGLLGVGQELLEVLARQEVVPFPEIAETVDVRRHRTVRTIKTLAASEHNQIAEVLRSGFLLRDGVLRPEEVIVKKYEAPEATERGDAS
jgi:molecular chaperone GrpE (heat shock protein)